MNLFWNFFWLISGTMTFLCIMCMSVNNVLFFKLNTTIKYLTDIAKPQLVLNNKPTEARFVTKDELPILKIWHNESTNYGLINILSLICAILFVVFGGFLHDLPYIINVLCVMFMLPNLYFFPRAYIRKSQVSEMLINYMMMIALLGIVGKETNQDDTGKQSSS